MSSANLYIVIIGCGRLGSLLANRLSHEGHSVVVIDLNPGAFEALTADQFSGFRVEGDATELAVLKQAKMDKADVVISATQDENVNIMTAQIARNHFHVPKVLVRILDPNKEDFCRRVGLECVCPPRIAAERMILSLYENQTREIERSL